MTDEFEKLARKSDRDIEQRIAQNNAMWDRTILSIKQTQARIRANSGIAEPEPEPNDDTIDELSIAILDSLAEEYGGDTPASDRLKIAYEIAPELALLVGMMADVSDYKMEVLHHSQLVNLVKDLRNEAREIDPDKTKRGLKPAEAVFPAKVEQEEPEPERDHDTDRMNAIHAVNAFSFIIGHNEEITGDEFSKMIRDYSSDQRATVVADAVEHSILSVKTSLGNAPAVAWQPIEPFQIEIMDTLETYEHDGRVYKDVLLIDTGDGNDVEGWLQANPDYHELHRTPRSNNPGDFVFLVKLDDLGTPIARPTPNLNIPGF